MIKEEFTVSIDSELLKDAKWDLNVHLRTCIATMLAKKADAATVSLKIKINMERTNLIDADGNTSVDTRPQLAYECTTTIPEKFKTDGEIHTGDGRLVWDSVNKNYAIVRSDGDQTSLFGGDEGRYYPIEEQER